MPQEKDAPKTPCKAESRSPRRGYQHLFAWRSEFANVRRHLLEKALLVHVIKAVKVDELLLVPRHFIVRDGSASAHDG